MARFYRVQKKGYSFEDMCNHVSADGGDGYDEGLAVSGRPDGLDGGSRFGGAWDAMDPDDEVIVLEGRILCEIYDGYRIEPTREIARFTVAQWEKMLNDGRAWDWE
jgi:hypothetical protein